METIQSMPKRKRFDALDIVAEMLLINIFSEAAVYCVVSTACMPVIWLAISANFHSYAAFIECAMSCAHKVLLVLCIS